MESSSNSAEGAFGSRAWRRARRFLMISGTLAALIAGWAVSPIIKDRVGLHLAERAIDAGRFEEAEARLDLLIEEKPSQTWPRFLRARLAREQGHFTQAEEDLQRALDLGLPIEVARQEHEMIRAGAVRDPAPADRVVLEGSPPRE